MVNQAMHYYYTVNISNQTCKDGWFTILFKGKEIKIRSLRFQFSEGRDPLTYKECVNMLEGTDWETIEGIFKK